MRKEPLAFNAICWSVATVLFAACSQNTLLPEVFSYVLLALSWISVYIAVLSTILLADVKRKERHAGNKAAG